MNQTATLRILNIHSRTRIATSFRRHAAAQPRFPSLDPQKVRIWAPATVGKLLTKDESVQRLSRWSESLLRGYNKTLAAVFSDVTLPTDRSGSW